MKCVKLYIFGFIVALLFSVGVQSNDLYAAPKAITDIKVIDIPNDDGTGLQIEWKALPKESRIISYRIYRGTSKDTLFFIGEIPINVKTGANSASMSYYDKDYNEFLDIRSPGRLKPEKKAGKTGPFYQKIPKDMKIVGPMLKDYSILGVIAKDEYYHKTKKITKIVNEKEQTYAGLKSNQITLVKKLIPGKEYFYSIIAVDEKRNYWPAETVVSGKPIDNEPADPADFYATYLPETQTLSFEWGHPLSYDDINTYKIFVKSANDAAPGKLIYESNTPQPFASPDYAILKLQDQKVVKSGNVLFDFSKTSVDQCEFYIMFTDYSMLSSMSQPITAKYISKSDLPVIPRLNIIDKKNDKGDYNTLFWGKPVAYINSVQTVGKNTIQLSYDYGANCGYKINQIYFDIYDKDNKLIKKVNEFFQDNIFKLKLDKSMEKQQELNIKISFKYNGKVDDKYIIEQKLVYDPIIMSLRPSKISVDGRVLEDFNFTLMKKTQNTTLYRSLKKVSGIERESDDKVAYESSILKGVSEYSLENNMFLVDTNIDVYWNKDTQSTISTSIYVSEKDNVVNKIKQQIAEVEGLIEKTNVPAEIEYYESYLTKFKNDLVAIESDNLLKEINSISNEKLRMKKIASIREVDKRKFNYFMMMSNGKGYVVEDSLNINEDGELDYVIPVSNWFDMEKLPTLIASLLFGMLVFVFVTLARKGKNLYIRPIAGIDEIDNAIGRATEMGRPILFCPGLSGIGDVATLAGLSILGRIAKKAAEYDTRILVPCRDYIVIPIAQEIVREAHFEAGRPDSFDKNNVFFVSDQQFAYVAGVNGVMLREKTATNFYMGMFYAESLIMTETGSTTGAIQIAGTDAVTQVPFFITTCDYTLIGEELYAASAYLARQPLMLGTLKAQDYAKFFILLFLILGTILSSFHITTIINIFPNK